MKYVQYINSLIKEQVETQSEIVLFGQNINAGSCLSGLTRGLTVKNNGLLIKLPQKNLLEALQFAHKVKLNKKIKENKIIDLRISNYMITYNE